MKSHLQVLDSIEPESETPSIRKDNVIAINPNSNILLERLSNTPVCLALSDFKYGTHHRDSKIGDYILIGILILFIHSVIVDQFKKLPAEPIEKPIKPPSKVQITIVKPQPPKPLVQPPPPPPPKVVALKKPPKPKVPPKPQPVIEPTPAPTPSPAPVTDIAAPVLPAPPAPPVVEKVTQPRAGAGYLNNPAPVYPDEAMEKGWEGKVQIKVHVLASGKPDTITIAKSSGKEVLDDEAIRTVSQWSFVPAMRGTTPTDGWVVVPISFNLQN